MSIIMSKNRSKNQYRYNFFLGYLSFPGFPPFPGIWNFSNKYRGFVPGSTKIAVNGRIHCELQIRVQDFENFNQRKFCEPLNI